MLVTVCLTIATAITAFGVRDRLMRTWAMLPVVGLSAVLAASVLPGAWAATAWALIVVVIELVVLVRPRMVDALPRSAADHRALHAGWSRG